MKRIIVMGVVLIVLGILARACGGIPSASRERGIYSASSEPAEKTWEIIPFPPPLGGAALGVGIILIILAVRTKP